MRIEKVIIENFKNVAHGELSFENKRKPDGPSILALYGQNGSGKSALVDCMLAFKLLLTGEKLPQHFASFVNQNADFARLTYVFDSVGGRSKYEIEFENANGFPVITNESMRAFDPEANRFRTLFTTKGYDLFGPRTLLREMGEDEIARMEECYQEGASFFFVLDNPFPDESECFWVANCICADAEAFLYVVGTKEAETIESGKLTIPYDFINTGVVFEDEPIEVDGGYGVFEYTEEKEGIWNTVDISTDPSSPSYIPHELAAVLELALFNDVNYLIGQLIPGMKLRLLGGDAVIDDIPVAEVYIGSVRGDNVIPLSCESRGIQKIVSVAWLLINVYSNEDFVAVIDEIDSGIFEYLLGELLKVIAEEGEGQLICTSHNLRPLEVIDKGYIAFTTANPENRYMRLKNVKATNNLRDFYYRSIFLGGQKESIYEPASAGDLSMGFIMAGSRMRHWYESDDDY